ncbi:MAG: class I SAM-dependent RNA methyltransferase [Treponema sp.]|jgi:23S rRNA (uracil1939-C5)-methyltransferase|nr:class I SAM-dependent RNA methyltransferase [Treponema sp.]
MAVGDIVSALVEKLVPGGEGLAVPAGRETEGKKLFIPLSAPGDRLRVRITEEHGTWARGEIEGLEEPSPRRVPPRCPLYGVCGGCSLQHLSYEAQLEAKAAILEETLRRGPPGETPEEVPPVTLAPSAPWEYRNRVSLHALRVNRGPRAGFKARRDGRVIPLEDCPAADPGIRAVLGGIRPPPGKDRFTLYSRGGLLLAEEGTETGRPGGETPPAPGRRGTITLLNREITLDAGYFFQSNAGALQDLIRRVRENLQALPASGGAGGPSRMADLYAGVGTFSLFLGDLFPGGADLVEADPGALSLARENTRRAAALGGAVPGERFRFFPLTGDRWIRRGNLGAYDCVVVDPPRQGLSPGLVRGLCEGRPPALVYVSCEPTSFARDYRLLRGSYALKKLLAFDFYPQTAHIECLGIFHRRKGG